MRAHACVQYDLLLLDFDGGVLVHSFYRLKLAIASGGTVHILACMSLLLSICSVSIDRGLTSNFPSMWPQH
jgi:hypothetical protein